MSNTKSRGNNDAQEPYSDLEAGTKIKWEVMGPGNTQKLQSGVITHIQNPRLDLLSTQYVVETGVGQAHISSEQVVTVLNDEV